MTTLKGRNALVIGGSSGIGTATVRALLAHGADVMAVARRVERLEAPLTEVGAGLTIQQADATDEGLVNTLLRERMPALLVISLGVMPHMARIDVARARLSLRAVHRKRGGVRGVISNYSRGRAGSS